MVPPDREVATRRHPHDRHAEAAVPARRADAADRAAPAADLALAVVMVNSAYMGWLVDARKPVDTWDGTEAARKLLSGIYRFWQHGQQRFGAGHLIDVLRGKQTDKVRQYGHASLSTFGVGADLSAMREPDQEANQDRWSVVRRRAWASPGRQR